MKTKRTLTPERRQELVREVGERAIGKAATVLGAKLKSLVRRGYSQEQADSIVREAAYLIPDAIQTFNEWGGITREQPTSGRTIGVTGNSGPPSNPTPPR